MSRLPRSPESFILSEGDAFTQTLPPLSEEHSRYVQELSPWEAGAWAISEAKSCRSDLYACRLSALYNSTLPVNWIPPELLLKVFESVEGRHRNSKWAVGFAGVCRYWRGILLSSPLIWSFIDLSNRVPFIQLCLSRSADTDIHVYLHDAASRSVRPSALHAPRIKDVLAPHFHRIARLELEPFSLISLHEASMLQMLEGPMPRLTELKMSGFLDIGRSFRLHLDGAHFSQLRTLSLSKIFLKCDGLVLPNLTALDLSAIPISRQPTLNSVLDLLEATHCMHTLTFVHAGPALPPSDFDLSRRSVALNRLHHFVFSGRSTQCSALLSHLLLPHGVRIQLLGDPLHMPDDAPAIPADTKTLMTIVPENMKHGGALSTIHSVWLQVSGQWFVLTADAKHLDKRNKKPTLLITLESQEDNYNVFAPNALSELPLIFHDALTSLHVESGGLSTLHRTQWIALFASFPRLLHLWLLSRTPLSEEFLKALGRSGHSLPCPKLKLLSLRCERGTKKGVEEMLEGLHECVLDRSRAGARLATLKVVIPSLSSHWEEHTSRFEGLVDALMFDNPENTQPD